MCHIGLEALVDYGLLGSDKDCSGQTMGVQCTCLRLSFDGHIFTISSG